MAGNQGRAIYVIDAVRTPFGRRGKALSALHPVDLLAAVLNGVTGRCGVPVDEIGRVVGGCVEKTGEQAFNITRTACVTAGLPHSVPATTVDAQCGSSQEAFTSAHAYLAAGMADVAIAAGVESMSRVPMATTFTAGPGEPLPPSYLAANPFPNQFESAESMAVAWGVTRRDCDELAVRSNERALRAAAAGYFDAHLLPIAGLVHDENPRETAPEAVAALEPLAGGGVHTSATASKVADGASAVLLASEDAVRRLGLRPLARVVRPTLVGVSTTAMLTGPIAATRRLLDEEGLTVADVDHFEINEAFASVVLAWAAELKVDLDRVNPNGGALAHGHPLGATGTALIGKAVHELRRTGDTRALVSMCCGGGLGTGTLLERV